MLCNINVMTGNLGARTVTKYVKVLLPSSSHKLVRKRKSTLLSRKHTPSLNADPLTVKRTTSADEYVHYILLLRLLLQLIPAEFVKRYISEDH